MFAFRDEIDRWMAATEGQFRGNGAEAPEEEPRSAAGEPAPTPPEGEAASGDGARRAGRRLGGHRPALAIGAIAARRLVALGWAFARFSGSRTAPSPVRGRTTGRLAHGEREPHRLRLRRRAALRAPVRLRRAEQHELRHLARRVRPPAGADRRHRRGRPQRGPGQDERRGAGEPAAVLSRGGRPDAVRPPAHRHPAFRGRRVRRAVARLTGSSSPAGRAARGASGSCPRTTCGSLPCSRSSTRTGRCARSTGATGSSSS